jgi:hypothetical protein
VATLAVVASALAAPLITQALPMTKHRKLTMAKKAKPAKKRKPPTNCMMVIRVSVPRRDVKRGLKVVSVYGSVQSARYLRKLEILNAYFDIPGVPNARH